MCVRAGSTQEEKLDLCYGSTGRSDHNGLVSRVEVATTLGWTFTS